MQFEFISSREHNRMLFNESDYNDQVNATFTDTFKKLGGIRNFLISGARKWTFPASITSQVISEIIKNTCFKCGGLMTNGEAIVNNKMYVQKDQGQVEYINPESTKLITVRKCTSCGHSHT